MNAMGGNGISMGFNELYSALQTGVVDGAENNPPTFLTQNHYQVTKYYNLTGHLIIPEILVFSRKTYDSLAPSDQQIVMKLGRATQFVQRELWDAMVTKSVADLKEKGVTFVEVDKKVFYNATQPVRDKYGAKYAALIKRIEATT
jgi:TRAP-type C4-dicarboxylate transport system substrate-binding protein